MKTKEILLIDDDNVINVINKLIVKTVYPEYTVKIFLNGLTAIQYIKQNSNHEFLIFLDINMPVMNGWEFLETVSSLPFNTFIEIHILTSSVDRYDSNKAMKTNLVKSYISKPLKFESLKNIP